MNIFILDYDVNKSAEYLDNTRCAKMILETCQILSTVLNDKGVDGLYKSTHVNHPCVLWAKQTQGNLYYLFRYLNALLDVYGKRYGKEHSSTKLIPIFKKHITESDDMTPFVLCMPDEFKCSDVVKSYRNYVASKPLIRYFYDDIPDWFLEVRKIPFFVKCDSDEKYTEII